MPRDTKKTIERLTEQVFTCPVEVYLLSEKFSDFCRKYDLCDAWKEYLQISQDKPDLYGSAVTKNAFILFLHHIFHSRREEFPELFTRFLIDFSQGISCMFPVDDLKKDLMQMGFSDEEIEHKFSNALSFS